MLVSGLGARGLALCSPGKLLLFFVPQCALLKNGHSNNSSPNFIHSFIQHIVSEHPVG